MSERYIDFEEAARFPFLKFKILKSEISIEHILCAMLSVGHSVGTRQHSMVVIALFLFLSWEEGSLILEGCSGFIFQRPNHPFFVPSIPSMSLPCGYGEATGGTIWWGLPRTLSSAD